MKKKYLSPDIQVEAFIAQDSAICGASGLPDEIGETELPISGL